MFSYLLYRIGQFLALSLPIKLVYGIAVFISDLHYLFAFKDHRAVKANLKVIFPDKSDREIRGIRLRMSRNFAKYLADFFRFEKIDQGCLKKNIHIENEHYLKEALSKGRGAIIVSAHIGNWELGGVAVALAGYPLWVVVLPHKDKLVDDFFNFQRKRKGVNVIPLGKAVRACLGVLKENKVLGLVGDRDFTEKGMVLDFFGKPAFFPEGPAAFALKTGAVIIPGFMLRNSDDSFTLKVEKPLEFNPSGSKEKDLRELIISYKNIFQDYIRRYPDQWFMFKRFWI